ncbi:hypothetical protein FRC06_011853, partial [Ceratobasidium sp. 370]
MVTSINSLITNLAKLDVLNYHDWAFDIEMIAQRARTWEVLTGDVERPGKSEEMTEQAEWDRKNHNVLTRIGLTA